REVTERHRHRVVNVGGSVMELVVNVGAVHAQVDEMRVILHVHQHVGEVPLVGLRVVGKVKAKGNVMSALKRLLERQLILKRRNGLRDVPLASGREQTV